MTESGKGRPSYISPGMQFGRLRVVKRAENDRYGHARWWCVCSCGTYTIVTANRLLNGASQSCGCYRREKMREIMRAAHTSAGHKAQQ